MRVDTPRLSRSGPAPAPLAAVTNPDDQADQSPPTIARFRRGIAHLPTGVTVVTSGDEEGAWYGVTTTSVCALSTDPPTLITCVPRRGGLGQHLGRTRGFCVNLLSQKQRGVAEAFAGRCAAVDRFRHGRWVSGTTGSPVLTDGLAAFECELDLMYGYPNHVVVIGRVEQVTLPDEPGEPLVHIARRFSRLVDADAVLAAS